MNLFPKFYVIGKYIGNHISFGYGTQFGTLSQKDIHYKHNHSLLQELTSQLDELKQEKQELHDKIKEFGNDREDINSEINQCIVTSNDLKAQERNKKHEKQSLQSKEKEANQENNELGKKWKIGELLECNF